MIFTENYDKLYYNDTIDTESMSMLSTTEVNKKHCTQQQYERAKIARELYQTVGYTSIKHYKNIIKMNVIKSLTVAIEDIDICEKIFGPNIYTSKRKMLRTKQKLVVNDYIGIPQKLKDTHQNIEFCSNIMYIQGHMFLLTIPTGDYGSETGDAQVG